VEHEPTRLAFYFEEYGSFWFYFNSGSCNDLRGRAADVMELKRWWDSGTATDEK
jgi:hypothetical protein